ncbi:hypothetical protein [Bosea sp. BH3]|uniref:hypothetical protein n=1 Tax=Bosea sp. BH3 TaxID=2871701 RepID=UPI0021CAF386|nr:hypothetical protein [Bosea sp. BH3]MCU4178429.1 hypothetical protein [Bosea sp. BH3]
MRLRSDQAVSRLQDGLHWLRPRLAMAATRSGVACRRLGMRAARTDIVPFLITTADLVESSLIRFSKLLRRLVPRRGLGLTGALAWRGAAALCGIGLTAILITGLSAKDEEPAQLAALRFTPPSGSDAPQHRPQFSAAADGWMPVARPIAIFSLESPELGREPPSFEARRKQEGSEREDLMSFGGFPEAGPHLSLHLRTGAPTAAGSASFTIGLVHEAARRGLAVERSSMPAAIETRFGPLDTADVVLGDGSTSRSCVAFRTAPGATAFAMSGWWCAGTKPSDRRQLTCLVDRLDLAHAAADAELRSAFARSELKRQTDCAPQRLSASGRKASWLDVDGNVPALRMKTANSEPIKIPPERPKRRTKPPREL